MELRVSLLLRYGVDDNNVTSLLIVFSLSTIERLISEFEFNSFPIK